MSIEIIDNQADFQDLRAQWNKLLTNSASHVPFLRHEYLTSWWQTKGGGEWEEGDLNLLIARSDERKITGIAPFFHHQDRLLLLGSHQISDYLDFISPNQHLETFLQQTLNHLEKETTLSWKTLDLYNLLESSPSLPLLQKEANDRQWKYTQERIHPAPLLKLPDSWEAYLSNLESRYRHEIERKIRRAEGYFLPVDWYIVEDEDQLDDEVSSFLELMAYNQEKADFLTDTMACQMRKAIHHAFQEGWLQLSFLTVGDIKAAGYLNFDFQNRLWIYNSGLNPMFENISPGWVLLGYLIEWAIDHQREAVDFMRGSETYKYQLGGEDRHVVRSTITRG